MDLVKDTVGYIMVVYAVGAGIGAPIGGWMYDIAKNFDGVFYFCASIYVLGGFCGWCALIFNKRYEQITAQYLPL